jgi:hypothetical protein
VDSLQLYIFKHKTKIMTAEKHTAKLPVEHMAEISPTLGKQLLGVD